MYYYLKIIKSKNGNTPLHLAIENKNSKLILYLIRNNSSLVIKNKEGKYPIDIAVKENNWDLVKYLTKLSKIIVLKNKFDRKNLKSNNYNKKDKGSKNCKIINKLPKIEEAEQSEDSINLEQNNEDKKELNKYKGNKKQINNNNNNSLNDFKNNNGNEHNSSIINNRRKLDSNTLRSILNKSYNRYIKKIDNDMDTTSFCVSDSDVQNNSSIVEKTINNKHNSIEVQKLDNKLTNSQSICESFTLDDLMKCENSFVNLEDNDNSNKNNNDNDFKKTKKDTDSCYKLKTINKEKESTKRELFELKQIEVNSKNNNSLKENIEIANIKSNKNGIFNLIANQNNLFNNINVLDKQLKNINNSDINNTKTLINKNLNEIKPPSNKQIIKELKEKIVNIDIDNVLDRSKSYNINKESYNLNKQNIKTKLKSYKLNNQNKTNSISNDEDKDLFDKLGESILKAKEYYKYTKKALKDSCCKAIVSSNNKLYKFKNGIKKLSIYIRNDTTTIESEINNFKFKESLINAFKNNIEFSDILNYDVYNLQSKQTKYFYDTYNNDNNLDLTYISKINQSLLYQEENVNKLSISSIFPSKNNIEKKEYYSNIKNNKTLNMVKVYNSSKASNKNLSTYSDLNKSITNSKDDIPNKHHNSLIVSYRGRLIDCGMPPINIHCKNMLDINKLKTKYDKEFKSKSNKNHNIKNRKLNYKLKRLNFKSLTSGKYLIKKVDKFLKDKNLVKQLSKYYCLNIIKFRYSSIIKKTRNNNNKIFNNQIDLRSCCFNSNCCISLSILLYLKYNNFSNILSLYSKYKKISFESNYKANINNNDIERTGVNIINNNICIETLNNNTNNNINSIISSRNQYSNYKSNIKIALPEALGSSGYLYNEDYYNIFNNNNRAIANPKNNNNLNNYNNSDIIANKSIKNNNTPILNESNKFKSSKSLVKQKKSNKLLFINNLNEINKNFDRLNTQDIINKSNKNKLSNIINNNFFNDNNNKSSINENRANNTRFLKSDINLKYINVNTIKEEDFNIYKKSSNDNSKLCCSNDDNLLRHNSEKNSRRNFLKLSYNDNIYNNNYILNANKKTSNKNLLVKSNQNNNLIKIIKNNDSIYKKIFDRYAVEEINSNINKTNNISNSNYSKDNKVEYINHLKLNVDLNFDCKKPNKKYSTNSVFNNEDSRMWYNISQDKIDVYEDEDEYNDNIHDLSKKLLLNNNKNNNSYTSNNEANINANINTNNNAQLNHINNNSINNSIDQNASYDECVSDNEESNTSQLTINSKSVFDLLKKYNAHLIDYQNKQLEVFNNSELSSSSKTFKKTLTKTNSLTYSKSYSNLLYKSESVINYRQLYFINSKEYKLNISNNCKKNNALLYKNFCTYNRIVNYNSS